MRAGLNNSHGVKEHTFGLASPPNQCLLYMPSSGFARGNLKEGDAMNSYPDFEEKCGYGHVQGIGGANCR